MPCARCNDWVDEWIDWLYQSNRDFPPKDVWCCYASGTEQVCFFYCERCQIYKCENEDWSGPIPPPEALWLLEFFNGSRAEPEVVD